MTDAPEIDGMDSYPVSSANFPPDFLDFLKTNHIDPRIYDMHHKLPRYVRILNHTHLSPSQTRHLIDHIQTEANCPVTPVAGIPGFLAIADHSLRLSQLAANKQKQIVGIDVSSGIAVLALSVEPGDNVLDLCCAPGAKLLYLAELVASKEGSNKKGSVTGVDIAPHRAATCRGIITKYAGQNKGHVRIYIDDGTTFDAKAPPSYWWDPAMVQAKMKETSSQGMSKRHMRRQQGVPWFAAHLLSTPYAIGGTDLYDRVLVDAECTHDGSLAHILKYKNWGWDQLETQVVGMERPSSVPVLQSRLLENGWRLLRPGGILVYSTCSLSRNQNELVLAGFLNRHAEDEACVEPIDGLRRFDLENSEANVNGQRERVGAVVASPIWSPQTEAEWLEYGLGDKRHLFARMQNAARFDPLVSNTSGMFIARIRKLRHSCKQFEQEELVPF
ncbi:hypothetical protein H4R99_006190 [Coemansia sp. RSA 1722]|nr:hypothetical protein IWW45_006615 [Coemansia sp. RSA 485]KAJ2593115.1 hypothetical protein H4R99_006190 [Coemansia sp. RSA 1722]KAJ2638495.1 hypothetical protein GGF40_001632 [Coemansia sp. RSA 1286]